MTLREFLDAMDPDVELTVYYKNQPIYFWFDDDPRYKWKVVQFGVMSKSFEMYVDITD